MKITSEHVARLLEARLHRLSAAGPSPKRDSAAPAQSDRATFSSLLGDMRAGLAAARRTTPQRSFAAGESRLTSLAAQVQSGRYRVPAEQIADALLRDFRGL
jgi:anti-sigma28 factor (negative regulator of flagellin synthesis)